MKLRIKSNNCRLECEYSESEKPYWLTMKGDIINPDLKKTRDEFESSFKPIQPSESAEKYIFLLACGTQVRAFKKRDETTESEPSYLQRTYFIESECCWPKLKCRWPKINPIYNTYKISTPKNLDSPPNPSGWLLRPSLCHLLWKAKVEVCAFRQLLYKPN